MHLVKIDRKRPDFRVLIDLLFGRGWNVLASRLPQH
jgi:hypothetical protein